jgi:hypothetical protein
VFLSLDFVYVPARDVDAAAEDYVRAFGAELKWRVAGLGTRVACMRVPGEGPLILLSGHLEGQTPILVYRVGDFRAAVSTLGAAGVSDLHELEIPHGPCASFRVASGQRYAAYELTRPGAAEHFDGRIDP